MAFLLLIINQLWLTMVIPTSGIACAKLKAAARAAWDDQGVPLEISQKFASHGYLKVAMVTWLKLLHKGELNDDFSSTSRMNNFNQSHDDPPPRIETLVGNLSVSVSQQAIKQPRIQIPEKQTLHWMIHCFPQPKWWSVRGREVSVRQCLEQILMHM